MRLLEPMLEAAAAAGLLRAGGKASTDSTRVLAKIRTLVRLERVGETARRAEPARRDRAGLAGGADLALAG
jgi:hypothetical protein